MTPGTSENGIRLINKIGERMKRFCLLLLFSGLLFSIYPQEKFSELEEFIDKANKENLFSGVVLIAEKSKPVFNKAAGYASLEENRMNNMETKFSIGSIGKLFTRIMIVQLIQEGLISLDDPLGSVAVFYGEPTDKKILIRNLVNFTAGTGDYFRIPEFRKDPMKYKEVKDLAALIVSQPLLFEPGTSESYSNSGYVLLGRIIEEKTKKSYIENLHTRILKPLGMDQTGFIYKGEKTGNKAEGYELNFKGEYIPVEKFTFHVPTPAGGMYSNAYDLLKLYHSLLNDNKLLNDKHKVVLFGGEADREFEEMKNDSRFGNVYAGGSPGWNSILGLNVHGYAVIIHSNYSEGAERIFGDVRNILNGKAAGKIRKPLGMFVYDILKKRGNEYLLQNYKTILREGSYEIEGDQMLNNLGYQFLNNNYIEEALTVFNVNKEMFPGTANTYDSLGEAYLKSGNKEAALENYKKALELNPQNQNAKEIIDKLSE
jgi:CubicO group peptidase (beta-lactamase class C family)